jgi:hypothetical protein
MMTIAMETAALGRTGIATAPERIAKAGEEAEAGLVWTFSSTMLGLEAYSQPLTRPTKSVNE